MQENTKIVTLYDTVSYKSLNITKKLLKKVRYLRIEIKDEINENAFPINTETSFTSVGADRLSA